jgi:hypothetical protein
MFKPGQNLTCTVIAQEQNGYTVSIAPNGVAAFLHTSSTLTIGTQIDACFVMLHEGRPLVADKSQLLEQGRKQLTELADKTNDPVIRETLIGVITRSGQNAIE